MLLAKAPFAQCACFDQPGTEGAQKHVAVDLRRSRSEPVAAAAVLCCMQVQHPNVYTTVALLDGKATADTGNVKRIAALQAWHPQYGSTGAMQQPAHKAAYECWQQGTPVLNSKDDTAAAEPADSPYTCMFACEELVEVLHV